MITYDPEAQTVANVAPKAQLEPEGHGVQTEALVDEENVPDGHKVETPLTQ